MRKYPHATYCADGAHPRSRLALCIIKCRPHDVNEVDMQAKDRT